MNYISLREIIEELDLEVIYASSDIDDIKIYSIEISRPGLQIGGYFNKFVPDRIQIIGNAEWYYYETLPLEERIKNMDMYFSYDMPALIFSRNLDVFPEMIHLAKKYDRTILRSKRTTASLSNKMASFIELELAPETRVHGVFVEVFGIGVLITGKSGVGKSETALDLVTRGHRLISDDTVMIKDIEGRLMGKSPVITRHFMEIRGLGILDIERLYGVGSVKNYEYIDLVVELELWNEDTEYDRIGLDESFTRVLNLEIPTATIPVRPGRNVAMILEVAVRNFRQKLLGYNAAEELNERIKSNSINKK
ncbi:HPr(Ser) kinase/phosphatase [Tissierella creatinophila]|uniref:HPr kinase/phosphorylase n=1 Tax=Tissierella creatinophila DSM 6911 TaxID=1123403 RepID=A0A1U7M7R0_TISCR|nr:HPr(Ser) kinase/phosphatase [Tissierella creatinophila]OLS03290.1 HPr kinase/phosphorylase [Tissierella creatinophila DSM 6911]